MYIHVIYLNSNFIKDSHAIRLLKNEEKKIVYFHSMYGIMLISPDNHNYIQFCEA